MEKSIRAMGNNGEHDIAGDQFLADTVIANVDDTVRKKCLSSLYTIV